MTLKTFRGHMTSNLSEEEALTHHLSWNRACHPTSGYHSDHVAPQKMYRDHGWMYAFMKPTRRA